MGDGQAAIDLIAREYRWSVSDVQAMPPAARRLALEFLTSRTATPRRRAFRWRRPRRARRT